MYVRRVMSLVFTNSASPPLNWLSSFTVKEVGSMQNFSSLYVPALMSLGLLEPPSIMGQVLAMPEPFTWRYVRPCSSSNVMALAACAPKTEKLVPTPRRRSELRDPYIE